MNEENFPDFLKNWYDHIGPIGRLKVRYQLAQNTTRFKPFAFLVALSPRSIRIHFWKRIGRK